MRFSNPILTLLGVMAAVAHAAPVDSPAGRNLIVRQFGCNQALCMECYRGCPNPSFCFQCQTSPVGKAKR
ncbi:hypothetical protein KVT40_007509 [Elsinoe batatas]|uniref:Uncharacterized protein n=1 Tax=Elsinoe batatas TaxID=2601811 RepID=A0A8K0KW78_9PEZI|nr:hypothetical protein KVT40_007509 [Elsinoe batatas]